MSLRVSVAARGSKLSRIQVGEVEILVRCRFPDVIFVPIWIETWGDCDQTISLRPLEKSDVFTREIDAALLRGEVRLAIHSAKDLPDPLPEGLCLVALTHEVSPFDALVVRLNPLPWGAVVGTSSKRREENLLRWRPDLRCRDIRGNIDERLELLDQGRYDAVIVAEAALIRLGLIHQRRWMRLDGETAAGQGRLAVVARSGDTEMLEMFSHAKEALSRNGAA